MVLQIWDGGLLIEPAPAPKPLADHEDCCCGDHECDYCDGAAPDEIAVTFAGFTDNNCNGCDEYLNDTFILERQANPCEYQFSDNAVNLGCVDDPHPVFIELNYMLNHIDLYLSMDYGSWVATFGKDYTEPDMPDCEPAAPVSIPWVSVTVPQECNGGSATASIDAVPP